MNPKPPPVTPNALRLEEALRRSEPLVRLRQKIDESRNRFDVVRPLLPAGLATHVVPGPVDEDGWSLLVANGAVAAKLRQLQPRLEAALRDRGWSVATIRVKVSPR